MKRHRILAPVAVLVVVVLMLAIDTPWTDLKRRHATAEPAPPDAVRWQRIVFVSAHRRGAYTIGGMTWALRDESVFLGLPVPLSWFGDAVNVPLNGIGGCRREVWSGGRRETELWFREAGVMAALPDQGDVVLKWCRGHGLPILTSKQYYEELQAQRQTR